MADNLPSRPPGLPARKEPDCTLAVGNVLSGEAPWPPVISHEQAISEWNGLLQKLAFVMSRAAGRATHLELVSTAGKLAWSAPGMNEQLAIDGAIAEILRPMRAALADPRHFTEEREACTKEILAFLCGRAGTHGGEPRFPFESPPDYASLWKTHRCAYRLRQQLHALRRPHQD